MRGNLTPFADDIQYLIKAGWTRSEAFGTKAMTAGNGNPAVRIAGFQPALSFKPNVIRFWYEYRRLNFFDELGLQPHRADAGDFTVDVMVAIHEADVFDFGSHFDDQ